MDELQRATTKAVLAQWEADIPNWEHEWHLTTPLYTSEEKWLVAYRRLDAQFHATGG